MTVSVYIGRNGTDGKNFDHFHEQEPSISIAQEVYRKFARTDQHFALIYNMVDPPIDLLIISTRGMGVVDLKNYRTPIDGSEDAPWIVPDKAGGPGKKLETGSHVNPFQQVRYYRKRVYETLAAFGNKYLKDMPSWLSKRESFYIQATVLFTAPPFDLSGLKIENRPWFSFQWQEDVAKWAASLTFGSNYQLSQKQIDLMALECFKAISWKEINPLLMMDEPYAYLWDITDTKAEKIPAFPLYLPEMVIGRSTEECVICLDPQKYDRVSRVHAKITKTATDVLITDCGSKNGTWVKGDTSAKGKELKGKDSHKLQRGHVIILGSVNEDGSLKAGSCKLAYRLNPPPINSTRRAETK